MPTGDRDKEHGFYAAYEEHTKTLRTWLVAYGIGAPVLFLTHDTLMTAIKKSGEGSTLGLFFLVGVGIQVGLAALNKTIMWRLYKAELDNESVGNHGMILRICDWLSDKYLIDFVADLATIALFALATAKVFRIVLAAA
jgi:hypothetical protein